MKFILILLFSFSAQAQTTAEWIDQQWPMLPRAERATKPSATIPILAEDREGLDLRVSPVTRNRYLNATYKTLAREFGQCLAVPMASWYHFGHWASRTSGRFMTGERFQQMGPLARAGLAVLSALGIMQSEKEVIQLFARTNFLIGVEMVPAGKYFLEKFCQGGSLPPFDVFGKHLEGGDLARQELHLAFYAYYLAIKETDQVRRTQLVAYGTTMQMMGEQRRAQYNVNALFDIGGPGMGLGERVFRWIAVSTTGLELGDGVIIPFNKHVSTEFMSPDLVNINLVAYKQLHAQHGVELKPTGRSFRPTAVQDWGNLAQRLRFLVAVVHGHGSRSELLSAGD